MKITLLTLLFLFTAVLMGKDLYVSQKTGSNSNDATKTAPLKNIEKALKKAKDGDKIYVAEGNYFGLRGKGYLEAKKTVELYGGYSSDFSKRDVLKYLTMIQPTNASSKKGRKALLTFTKSKKGSKIVVDGFIFDMGMKNSYSKTKGKPEGLETGMLLLPPAKEKGENPTVTEQCIRFKNPASSGDVLIQNNVFLNCAKFGIQAGHKQGDFKVLNNIFISNRMASIEVFGTGGKKGPKGPTKFDGNVEIANNTILFTWSRIKDFKDMGYGVRVMTKLTYNIHNNIFLGNILTGVDNTRFNKNEWLQLDNNLFLMNKQGDLMYTEAGQGVLERVMVKDFGDLEFKSVKGNSGKATKLPINEAYLKAFLNARYSEKADYDENSPSNQYRAAMGLNKQGKLKTKVTMFGNRYPLKDALKLFGAVKDMGAQKIK